MKRITIVVALAAGMLMGCKPQEPQQPAPTPTPTPKAQATPGPGDDLLTRTGPPSTPAPTLTPVPTTPPATPAPGETRKYVVKAHEGMMSIARTELGNEHRWKEIVALNPEIQAPDYKLKVGQVIKLPAK